MQFVQVLAPVAGTKAGDYWYVTTAGTTGSVSFNIGDVIIAKINAASTSSAADWIQLEVNRDQATESVLGLAEIATQAETATATASPAFAASTLNASLSESATATDAQSAIATMLAAIAEIATGTDSQDRGLLITASVSETATGTDVVSVITSVNATVAELASGLDAYGKLKILNVYPDGLQLNVYAGNVLVWGTIPTDQTPPDPDWQNIPT